MADIIITPGDVSPSSASSTRHYNSSLVAAEGIPAGSVVALNAANKAVLADANDVDRKNIIGFAGNSSNPNQRCDVITESPGVTIGAHGVTVGTPLFLSANPGKLCPLADVSSSGKTVVLIAFAADSTSLQIAVAKAVAPIP